MTVTIIRYNRVFLLYIQSSVEIVIEACISASAVIEGIIGILGVVMCYKAEICCRKERSEPVSKGHCCGLINCLIRKSSGHVCDNELKKYIPVNISSFDINNTLSCEQSQTLELDSSFRQTELLPSQIFSWRLTMYFIGIIFIILYCASLETLIRAK